MNGSSHPGRFAFGLLTALAAAFLAQTLLLKGPAARLPKGESNFFSSLARIQAAARQPNSVTLVGSSLTGRLPGMESGNAGVGNLGVDGGSTVEGLSLIDSGRVGCGPVLICETNTLLVGVGGKPSLLTRSVGKPWFEAGRKCVNFSAAARPSSMGYAGLLKWKRGAPESTGMPFVVMDHSEVSLAIPHEFSDAEERRILEVITMLGRQRSKGIGILLVKLPGGVQEPGYAAKVRAAAAAVSSAAEVPMIDLEAILPRRELSFTDGAHLAPGSAARVLATILEVAGIPERPSVPSETGR